MHKIIFFLGWVITFLTTANIPVKAQKCTPLPLVGGKGTEVEKTITTPSIPGPFGIQIASDNWNTDWAIPNTKRFRSYKARIISDEGGTFNIKMYLKYSDDTADPFYEQNDFELDAKKPLEIKTTSRRQEQPYQLNIFVGGIKSIGSQYRASVFGCQ